MVAANSAQRAGWPRIDYGAERIADDRTRSGVQIDAFHHVVADDVSGNEIIATCLEPNKPVWGKETRRIRVDITISEDVCREIAVSVIKVGNDADIEDLISHNSHVVGEVLCRVGGVRIVIGTRKVVCPSPFDNRAVPDHAIADKGEADGHVAVKKSLPSHRNLKKMVGILMKTCHTAGHE